MSIYVDRNVGNHSKECIGYAVEILKESDPDKKAELSLLCLDLWEQGNMKTPSLDDDMSNGIEKPPDVPGRSQHVRLVAPSQLPKRGRGGTLASRQALLHSLVHIESCAIDLAWDIIARFGTDNNFRKYLPKEFYGDFIVVAADEARHYTELKKRLGETGMKYGDLPAHDGLWESAMETAHSLPARLSVEHCVHEARGLDILPQTIERFRKGGDEKSAHLLETVIYPEEITHCGAGVKWLRYLFELSQRTKELDSNDVVPDWMKEAREFDRVEAWFHSLVRRHFHGLLKPPFNDAARAKAGFGTEWYEPLSTPQD